MNKSGLDELTDSLVKACKNHALLKDVDSKIVEKIISSLSQEQFSDDRKASMKTLNFLLDQIVEEMIEVI